MFYLFLGKHSTFQNCEENHIPNDATFVIKIIHIYCVRIFFINNNNFLQVFFIVWRTNFLKKIENKKLKLNERKQFGSLTDSYEALDKRPLQVKMTRQIIM